MNWSDVITVAIVVSGVVAVVALMRFGGSIGIEYTSRSMPRPRRRHRRSYGEKLLDHLFRLQEQQQRQMTWSTVTVTKTQQVKPDPKPLVTPPPADEKFPN